MDYLYKLIKRIHWHNFIFAILLLILEFEVDEYLGDHAAYVFSSCITILMFIKQNGVLKDE